MRSDAQWIRKDTDMNRWLTMAGAAGLSLACSPVFAAVNVFACLPEWASLATELGGDKVSVYQASNALQDPHRIEARPSLVARMRSADLAICTGAELEIGWLPVLLQTAGNQKVQPGKPGFIAAAELVDRLEIPTRLDRAEGDVHPAGNPHIQLDPNNIAKVATVVTQRLQQIDPRTPRISKHAARTFRSAGNRLLRAGKKTWRRSKACASFPIIRTRCT